MRQLFTAIREQNLETVQTLLNKSPALITSIAQVPPLREEGQSPLQVALGNAQGKYEIIHFLLDCNADVNFMEQRATSSWRMPAIQMALCNAIHACRQSAVQSTDERPQFTPEQAQSAIEACAVLRRMLELGGDLKLCDSYRNNALVRAIVESEQILPAFSPRSGILFNSAPLLPELEEDLQRIFHLLLQYGADPDAFESKYRASPREYFKNRLVARFLEQSPSEEQPAEGMPE